MADVWTEDEICHLYVALHGYDGMDLCGCGTPGLAFALIARILDWATDSTSATRPAELTDDAVAQLILSMFDHAGLMDHGMTMTYPWLTVKGRAVRALLGRVTDWDALDVALSNGNAGFPHDPDPCTDACWQRWDPGAAH